MKPTKPKAKPKAKPKSKVSVLPTGDLDARRLLERHRCPMGFHAVRAQFMGAIASPIERIQPLSEIKALWGGQFPPFDSMDDVNQLLQVLVMGLWNQLSGHTDPDRPFELTRFKGEATNDMLRAQAQVRYEELDAFRHGFYQRQSSLKLSPELAKACDVIDELISMYQGMRQIPVNPKEQKSERDAFAKTIDSLTEILEDEINFIICTVTQDRAALSAANPAGPGPTRH